MTAQPLQTSPGTPAFAIPTWAALSFALALAVQLGGVVAWGARVEARTSELRETTQPLRDGDLVQIRTDVAWIRSQLEREERR